MFYIVFNCLNCRFKFGKGGNNAYLCKKFVYKQLKILEKHLSFCVFPSVRNE